MEQGSVVGGRYRIESHVGDGGMGSVWTAVHLVTRKRVAIKLLHKRSADQFQRFEREARAACAVDHPNVVSVTDFFQGDDGAPLMVMELLAGETLRARLERLGSLAVGEALDVMVPVIEAVATAHDAGVVHRDLKPDNIFITRAGVPKVLDFGIAMLRDEAEDARLTPSGAMMGTVRYMAPEQAMAERQSIDHRADVWALGAILYEALSGRGPVAGDSVGLVIANLLTRPIVPLGDVAPAVPEDVCAVVDRMLARDLDERLADLRQVITELAPHRVPGAAGTPRTPEPRSVPGPASAPQALANASTETFVNKTPGPVVRKVKARPRTWLLSLFPVGAMLTAGAIVYATSGEGASMIAATANVASAPTAQAVTQTAAASRTAAPTPSASQRDRPRAPTSPPPSASAMPEPAPSSAPVPSVVPSTSSTRSGPSGISDKVPF
jgi:serine/threonine protein kinase